MPRLLRPRRRLLRSFAACIVVVAAVAMLAQVAGVGGGSRPRAGRALAFDGVYEQWLVHAPTAKGSQLRGAARALAGDGKTSAPLGDGWYEVELGDEVVAAEAEAAFAQVGADLVEPVIPRIPYADGPTAVEDPTPANVGTTPVDAARFGEQWSLHQQSDQDIDAPEAWGTTTGAGAIVAVIDTGVDAQQPNLAGRLVPGHDFSGSSTGATVDRIGHGTQVASIIAANASGIAGVAPDARIMPLKVFRDSESAFSMSGYVAAIRYAADHGADVINISLGCGGTTACYSQAELDALTYATGKGVLVVAAAGNGDRFGHGLDNDDPDTPDFPSGYELPGIVSVTSSTRTGRKSAWGNYGRESVDLAAPGEGILSAAPGGAYRTSSGTSFSAPLVSGTAALLAAVAPEATPDDLRMRLLHGVAPAPAMSGETVSGGILNAAAAIAAAGLADGGGDAGTDAMPTTTSPRPGARLARPPVLTWTLPSGWTTERVLLSGAGGRFDHAVGAATRAFAHPAAAWRAGTYQWQVVARAPSGATVTSPRRSYGIGPRLGAWISSGTLRSGGRSARLRIGYASNLQDATVRVRVLLGTRVIHDGAAVARTQHRSGVGSPHRGWFLYRAPLTRSLQRGQHVTVLVTVRSGGTSMTRRFGAKVT